MEMVEIKWEDATCDSGWFNPDKVKKLGVVTCKTIGYLFHETKKAYYLTGTFSDDLGVLGYNIIPKSMMVSKRVIKEDNDG